MGGMSTTGYRTLADQLRSWPDARLSRLLLDRPDLATPAPHDSGQLASRAATRSSLLRALDHLTRLELCVLDALVVVGQTTPAGLAEVVRAEPGVGHGRAGPAARPRPRLGDAPGRPRPERRGRGADPGRPGTGRQRAAPGRHPSRPPPDRRTPTPRRAVAGGASPARARPRLRRRGDHRHRPAHGAPRGRQHARPRSCSPAGSSCRAAAACVVLPGEVGIALRGGRTTTEPVDEPPELATSDARRPWSTAPAPGRRSRRCAASSCCSTTGACTRRPRCAAAASGVRDLRATAVELHVDEPTAALLVEVASAAGLIATAADPAAPRPGSRPTRSTSGPRGRSPSGGWRWCAPGSRARGSRAWSALATRRARCGTPSPPSCPASTRSRAGGWRSTCWPSCPTARSSRPGPASRRWCSGSSGSGRGDPGPAPTRSAGPSRRLPRSASPRSAD